MNKRRNERKKENLGHISTDAAAEFFFEVVKNGRIFHLYDEKSRPLMAATLHFRCCYYVLALVMTPCSSFCSTANNSWSCDLLIDIDRFRCFTHFTKEP